MSDPKAGIPFSIIIRTTFPSNFLRNKSAPLNQFYSMFFKDFSKMRRNNYMRRCNYKKRKQERSKKDKLRFYCINKANEQSKI